MLTIKIFLNYFTNHNRVVIKNEFDDVIIDDYTDDYGNILVCLKSGIYKLYLFPFKSSSVLYKTFFYDGLIKNINICFEFVNKLSLKKILLKDNFYDLPIMKGVVKFWQNHTL